MSHTCAFGYPKTCRISAYMPDIVLSHLTTIWKIRQTRDIPVTPHNTGKTVTTMYTHCKEIISLLVHPTLYASEAAVVLEMSVWLFFCHLHLSQISCKTTWYHQFCNSQVLPLEASTQTSTTMTSALPPTSGGYISSLFLTNQTAKANVGKVFLISSKAQGTLANKHTHFMGYYDNT